VRLAIRAGVPIVPIATVGGADAMPVLVRGDQLPLPAKIRTRVMPAVELDHDPDRADDEEYLEVKYWEVQNSIQQGMNPLARKRALPLFG
jgi:1-acyl-sn-glycerol-3-phosphate acyltransferase